MTNPIFPFSINKPILNLTTLLTHPLLEEISIALMSFVSVFLFLWLLSKIFNFKKQDYKISLFVALIVASASFIIRSINLIFSLADSQKPIINKFSTMVEIFLLLVLIKKAYNQKWSKSIITLIITYFGKFMIMGVIVMITLLFFTTIFQDIEKERRGDQIKIGRFETNRINANAFNFKSDISFTTKTENITMTSLKCWVLHNSLFSSIENNITEYKFKSFDYMGAGLKVEGSAYFDCSSACANGRSSMNTNSARGTKIIFIEGGENITLNFDFTVSNGENKTIQCTPIINSENPNFTTLQYAKLFEINYIAT